MGLAALFKNGLFALTILCEYPLSIITRKFLKPQNRYFFHIFFGLIICLFLYRLYFFPVLLGCLLSYLLLFLPGSLCLTSIIVPFIMLIGIHSYKYFHAGEWSSDVSGLIMFSFLRITKLAFNVFDGRKPPEKLKRKQWKEEALQNPPNMIHYLAYLFTFIGLYSGSFLPFKDFVATNDMTSSSEVISQDISSSIPYFISSFFICGVYGAGVQILPAKLILSESFKSKNYFSRFIISLVLSAVHTSRYIFVWICAEASWRALGAASINENFVSSITPSVYYTSRKLSVLALEWNRAIHFCLKECLHVRLIVLGAPQFLAKVATFLMSAIWHGFYTGYYLLAALETIFGVVDELRFKWFTPMIENLFGAKFATLVDMVWVQSFNYFMGAPWDLYWAQYYWEFYATMKFIPFVCLIIMTAVGFVYNSLFGKKKSNFTDKKKE